MNLQNDSRFISGKRRNGHELFHFVGHNTLNTQFGTKIINTCSDISYIMGQKWLDLVHIAMRRKPCKKGYNLHWILQSVKITPPQGQSVILLNQDARFVCLKDKYHLTSIAKVTKISELLIQHQQKYQQHSENKNDTTFTCQNIYYQNESKELLCSEGSEYVYIESKEE